jgi:hypothetical protein
MQPAFNTLHFHHAFFDSAVETFRALIVLYATLCLHENKLCNITLNCLLLLSNKSNETVDAYGPQATRHFQFLSFITAMMTLFCF